MRAFRFMVHSTGFEPVTARFVAEYSIQLSYECMWRLLNQITTGLLRFTSGSEWCFRRPVEARLFLKQLLV
jgi:hypothetical protein